ncbi:hypothetical protein IWX46DRAFT_252211 [Phyllosticta citricarpa]|uniref:Secreted protein n=1 Tax=Phyllosticta citricarpa TaxID=55181 RepID=A0ABR1LQY7_9PEZI
MYTLPRISTASRSATVSRMTTYCLAFLLPTFITLSSPILNQSCLSSRVRGHLVEPNRFQSKWDTCFFFDSSFLLAF